ncbi:MAG: hypothetical protein R2824_02500 [Saprospiraceae bacterium]|nr:hypothetical protein [Lewinella sp.]
MRETRKYLLDRFQQHLHEDYQDYCCTQGLNPSIQGLITFLIDKDVVSPKQIKDFTVLREFQELYPTQKYRKTQTVNMIADRFNISERSVWGIIRGVKDE